MHLFDKFPTFVQFVGKAYLNIFTRERILSNRYESNYLIYYYHSILYDPFAISYIAGHKADNEGFFVGNRKSAWYIVAFAMIGSTISGVTFVSVPGMVQASGFSYLQMVLGFIVGQFIIAFVLVPLFYRMNLVSIYEYLENRFGASSYKTGAWFFFISKMLGAAVRLFLVCLTLQLLIFEPFHIPFIINVILTVLIVWLYTFRGGVKSLIWTDVLKTFCLVVSVVLCIYYIASSLHLNFSGLVSTISDSDLSKMFFLTMSTTSDISSSNSWQESLPLSP